jgi:hypothetical protein
MIIHSGLGCPSFRQNQMSLSPFHQEKHDFMIRKLQLKAIILVVNKKDAIADT